MRVRLTLVAFLAAAAFHPVRAAGGFAALDPGGPAKYAEEVPVQFVFVGFTPAQVPLARFAPELAATGAPVVRSRLWYGVTEPLGIRYTYAYTATFAGAAYADAFFAELRRLATPESQVDGQVRTLFQDQYNAQIHNVLDVGVNHFIDAPSVERWLYRNPPPGVDPSRDTVFFVNWWGRPDFLFHTYTKFGEPDPDTGYDFGRNRQSRKIVAWGGTGPNDEETGFGAESRLWFHDLSAGPERWTDNWNVDDADVDGDGRADFRLPPAWEYFLQGGYRPLSALAGDLGKVARYVAVNLLFTPSPLYPPYLTPNRLPASIDLDLDFYDMYPALQAQTRYETPSLLVREISEVHRVGYGYDEQAMAVTSEVERCYHLMLVGTLCFPDQQQYPGDANLFLYNAVHKAEWRDGGAEYEAGFFNYVTSDRLEAPFLGFADDNWIDGTQSGTFNFISPAIVALGYGLTTTQIHEYGHHFGMSHPHDGYDSETGVDYGPEGAFYFANLGDEVNSMMSYIDLNWDYSQFDLDNANRFQATAYFRTANSIAAQVLASPNARAAAFDLKKADAELAASQAAMAAHAYARTFDHARLGYEWARSAAAKAGVAVPASDRGWELLPEQRGKSGVKREYAYRDRLSGTRRAAP